MDSADMPRHRPLAFDKMESLIKEMQDPETGVPVRSQKLFLSTIPSAFMGYDLVEWLMARFDLDESTNGEFEAINIANLLCQYGYFFPVNDSKNLVLKDDSSLYRFQSPYYWPWQASRGGAAGGGAGAGGGALVPDNVEYAIYLVKRTLRNKQKHQLEEYELEALANLKKNLAAKWDFITMQAEEQVRVAKERKKGDKIVSDSQERAYWRVARPPPGVASVLEPCPVPVRARATPGVPARSRRLTHAHLTREVDQLKATLDRTKVKASVALEALVAYSETFAPYDPWLTPPQPSNPWVTDDTLYWQINCPLVETPSEKRVARWAISIEELMADPTGLQEFTAFLRKEYSHENIRFWLAVRDLRATSAKHLPAKLQEIYEEFLAAGAPCEINIDGATGERARERMRTGSRYALDDAADHVYSLLLKKDCYPRFVRSDHYQRLLAEGRNVLAKKKFFNFGGQVKKKPGAGASGSGGGGSSGGGGGGLRGRRGSERSLSGSAHELAVCAAQPPRPPDPPPHSHSQSNLALADLRDPEEESSEASTWESRGRDAVYGSGGGGGRRRQDSGSSSSDVSERRRLPQQSTLDGGLRGAPPPLRRLSAVEPRHLAPLVSPGVSPAASPPAPATPPTPPVPDPAPALSAAPNVAVTVTPTINVSSAPPLISISSAPSSINEDIAITLSGSTAPTSSTSPATTSTTSSAPTIGISSAPAISVSSAPTISVTSAPTISVTSAPTISVTSAPTISVSSAPTSNVSSAPTSNVSSAPTISVSSAPAISVSSASEDGTPLDNLHTPALASAPAPPPSPPLSPALPPPKESTTQDKSDVNFINVIVSVSTVDSSEGPSEVQVRSSPVAAPPGPSVPPTAAEAAPDARTLHPEPPTTKVISPASIEISSSDIADLPESSRESRSEQLCRPAVAPLAQGEDTCVDDDSTADRVPSPDAAGAAGSAGPSAGEGPLGPSEAVPDPKLVKRDSNENERDQRNDVCPWEDENSCESEAPFVKTYATLGYL